MGDSLAADVLAQKGYVRRYATYVNTDTGSKVTTFNMGIPGWHSGDLLNACRRSDLPQSGFRRGVGDVGHRRERSGERT
jgi:hypothetical protein